MGTLDCLDVSCKMMDGWKCVFIESGDLYLMMDGQVLMLKLYADNWDTVHRVYKARTIVFKLAISFFLQT